MATSTLRFLGSILLLGATMGVAACGSTVTGDGDGADDDGQDDDGSDGGTPDCDSPLPADCESGVCVDGFWQCTAQRCPEVEPLEGDSCIGEDVSCRYEAGIGECDPSARTYACDGGVWSAPLHDRCSPPPPECPATEPAPMTTCDPYLEGVTCEYDTGVDCGPGSVAYTCEGGVWSDPMVPRCALPPCQDAGDADTCEGWGCRWLEPGCGDESIASLPGAGCFDAAPCGEEGCLFADQVCTQVMVLPDCVDEGCDACGQSDFVCLPSAAGG